MTSETMVKVGQATGMSPRRLQHVYDGFFGTMGSYVLAVADSAYRMAADAPPTPEKRLDDLMFIRSFAVQEPVSSTKWAECFWTLKTKADQLNRSVNDARKRGQEAVLNDLRRDGTDLLRFRDRLNGIADQLRDLRKREERIYTSESLSPAQKRERLDHITARKNDLYRCVWPIEEQL